MNGEQMNTKALFSSQSDEWETPQELFDRLNGVYWFTLDPCCQVYNAKCPKFYTQKDDGLSKDWCGETVFVNPPYGRSIGKWVKKCHDEAQLGCRIVMLIPARTDTTWFHNYLYKKPNVKIEFIRGRLKFVNRQLPSWNEHGDYKLSGAPFPSMLVYFNLEPCILSEPAPKSNQLKLFDT